MTGAKLLLLGREADAQIAEPVAPAERDIGEDDREQQQTRDQRLPRDERQRQGDERGERQPGAHIFDAHRKARRKQDEQGQIAKKGRIEIRHSQSFYSGPCA